MKQALSMIGALLALLLIGCGVSSGDAPESRDDQFAVGEAPSIVVRADSGRIVLRAGEPGHVRVKATLKNPAKLDYSVTQSGDSIVVETNEQGGSILGFGRNPSVEIEVTTPADSWIDLELSNGDMRVEGMHRSGVIEGVNGKVVLVNVVGEFEVSTVNGSVTISEAIGEFSVRTINGRIEFDGDLRPGGDNRMTTGNGQIRLNLRGQASLTLDASTSNGTVTTSLPILTTSSGDKRHLMGTIGAGDAELFARTSNGSITIQ